MRRSTLLSFASPAINDLKSSFINSEGGRSNRLKDHKTKKVLVMGYNETGKSSITLKFLYNFPDASNLSPEENYYTSIKYKEDNYLLHIVDFAGIDEYTPIYASKYGVKVDGYILVYAVDNRKSFEFVQELRDKLRAINGRDVPAVIVANKSDLRESREVSTEEGKKISRAFGVPYLEVSAKRHATDFIKKVFEVMLSEIVRNEDPENGLKRLKHWDEGRVEQLYELFLFASMLLIMVGIFFVSYGVINLLRDSPELIQTQGIFLVFSILNGFIILTLSVLGCCGMKKGENDCISVVRVLVVLSAILDIACGVLKFTSNSIEEDDTDSDELNKNVFINLDPLIYAVIGVSFILSVFIFGVSCLSKEIAVKKRLTTNGNKFAVLKV